MQGASKQSIGIKLPFDASSNRALKAAPPLQGWCWEADQGPPLSCTHLLLYRQLLVRNHVRGHAVPPFSASVNQIQPILSAHASERLGGARDMQQVQAVQGIWRHSVHPGSPFSSITCH